MPKEKRSKNQIRRERAKLRKLQGKTDDSTQDGANISPEIPSSMVINQEIKDKQVLETINKADKTTFDIENKVEKKLGEKAENEVDNEVVNEIQNEVKNEAENEVKIKVENEAVKAKPIVENQHDMKDLKTHNKTSLDIIQIEIDDPLYEQFRNVFHRYSTEKENDQPKELEVAERDRSDDDDDDDILSESDFSEPEATSPNLSKHQSKKKNKVPLAVLKASTSNPQMVDWYDADSADPFLLISMKLQHNAVQVPEHWSAKRDYLNNRKGIEKLPFELPKYIADTGISAMRGNVNEETLKQQQRARVQPKSGKLDIDYNKLHDAFFKFQAKPRLFGFGDIYFEGREDIDVISEEVLALKPGVVSSSLRKALGMPENDFKEPPPWLAIMNNLGKPPSYRNLVIPGLDAQYTNLGYREKGAKQITNSEYWGRLNEFVESSEEEDYDDEDEDEDDEGDEGASAEPEVNADGRETEDENEPVKVSIDSYGKSYSKKKSVDDNSDKSLYTVVKETKTENSLEGLLQSQFKYELEANKLEVNKLEEKPENSSERPKTKESTKFKF